MTLNVLNVLTANSDTPAAITCTALQCDMFHFQVKT